MGGEKLKLGCVYRYKDKADNIIKYIGIVWSDNSSLERRIEQHWRNDIWVQTSEWIIEKCDIDITNRTDAEYLESHMISLYETGKYFNVKKSNWGISSFLPKEFKWEIFKVPEKQNKNNIFKKFAIKNIFFKRLIQSLNDENFVEDCKINKELRDYVCKCFFSNFEDYKFQISMQHLEDEDVICLLKEVAEHLEADEKKWLFSLCDAFFCFRNMYEKNEM